MAKRFPPANADQILCKQNQLAYLREKQAAWFRQRAEHEDRLGVITTDAEDAPVGAEAARQAINTNRDFIAHQPLGGNNQPNSKARDFAHQEMHGLHQEVQEMKKLRDELRGHPPTTSITLDSTQYMGDEDVALQIALSDSLATASAVIVPNKVDLSRERGSNGITRDHATNCDVSSIVTPRCYENDASTSRLRSLHTDQEADDLYDNELSEINDFLLAVGLQHRSSDDL
mmetsp:Transcript_12730/g.24158  ORF Transcript_12730/g.24158 Transcript_12730/m.24158 type:complete len:230 (+) Transcript_12730:331-1020(+)|eukprot:CAMPEP_0114257276 /NCGR_PEP_ID=MMETSP0058-20121206/18633_1 /TAXON_ID=36894 /ORGANISM="Pyramimonas parkeae, CCMP726" /LENGTH=229 /DNA_ID=CAMNT_0001371965 /DNA_START=318 /DNA_END=1007 /DNA_ORIENTATION=+